MTKCLHISVEMCNDKVHRMSVCFKWMSLYVSSSPQNVSSEAEEGMIPDSPHRPLSLPVASKMKRRKEQNHVRYAETPLSLSYPGKTLMRNLNERKRPLAFIHNSQNSFLKGKRFESIESFNYYLYISIYIYIYIYKKYIYSIYAYIWMYIYR